MKNRLTHALFIFVTCAALAFPLSTLHGEDLNEAVFQMDSPDSVSVSEPDRRWQLSLSPGYAMLKSGEFEGIDYSNGISVEGSLFYQVASLLQFGIEGGYSFNHEQHTGLLSFGGYDFEIQDSLEIAHTSGAFRLGKWFDGAWKPWRPYLQAGLGWYELIRRQSFQVDANQFLYSALLQESTHDYLGALGGGGVEFEVYPSGVIGAQMIYHNVFSGPENLRFYIASLRCSYLF